MYHLENIMNKLQLSIVVAGISLTTGIYFSNSHKDLALTVGMSSGGLLLGVGGTIFVNQKFNQRKINLLVKDKKNLESTNGDLNTRLQTFNTQLNQGKKLSDELTSEVNKLTEELAQTITQLKLIESQKQTTDYQNIEHVKGLTKLQETNRHLVSKLENLQEIIKDKEARINELDTELENGWGEQVTIEAEKIFKKRAEKIIIEEISHDKKVAMRALEICEKYMRLTEEMYEDNEQHHQQAISVNDKAKEVITNLKQAEIEALGAKEDYIKDLQLKIERLNSQLDGEIIEPEKRKGMVGRYWDIANFLIDHMSELGTNLRVTGLEECGEYAIIAFGYSKSAVPTQICEAINKHGKVWSKSHGIHSIGNARLSPRFPAIEVTVYKDKPAQDTTEKVYQSGLIAAKLFSETVHKALDPKKGGKPTLRVMGATGDGKGIALKNYLEYLVKQSGWEIWLSDPVDGSTEDYWDCPKIATDASSAAKAYKKFLNLHDIREKSKVDGFTDLNVVGIFDEFDRNHSKEQHEEALRVMVSIRHTRLRQVLVGQCAEVGKNGWTWGDMTNCSLLALEKSIGILKKHLKSDMGWTSNQLKKLEKDYNQFTKWRDDQNAENPDIPYENRIRLGLLIIGDSYQFLEVPIAYKGFIRDTGASIVRESFENTPTRTTTSDNEHTTPKNHIQSQESCKNDLEKPVYCPTCHSTSITEIEPYKDGRRRFRCGKGHRFEVQPNQVREE